MLYRVFPRKKALSSWTRLTVFCFVQQNSTRFYWFAFDWKIVWGLTNLKRRTKEKRGRRIYKDRHSGNRLIVIALYNMLIWCCCCFLNSLRIYTVHMYILQQKRLNKQDKSCLFPSFILHRALLFLFRWIHCARARGYLVFNWFLFWFVLLKNFIT